ncbi:PepSY domain-containing protein [Candidatus Neomarinimicrobiota bacterium]
MARKSRKKLIRTWHRRLGPIIGLQLLLWSLGGIYFSWIQSSWGGEESDIVLKEPINLKYENFLAPIPPLIRNSQLAFIEEIRLGKLLNIPVYRMIQDDRHAETYNAITGEKISPIDRTTAIAIAAVEIERELPVRSVVREDMQSTAYQGPVPAWKVTFDDWKATTLYIGANTGRIATRRTMLSRIYGLFYALHLMEYGGGVKNWLIRIVSVLSLITIASGYYLWFLTTTTSAKPARAKAGKGGKK